MTARPAGCGGRAVSPEGSRAAEYGQIAGGRPRPAGPAHSSSSSVPAHTPGYKTNRSAGQVRPSKPISERVRSRAFRCRVGAEIGDLSTSPCYKSCTICRACTKSALPLASARSGSSVSVTTACRPRKPRTHSSPSTARGVNESPADLSPIRASTPHRTQASARRIAASSRISRNQLSAPSSACTAWPNPCPTVSAIASPLSVFAQPSSSRGFKTASCAPGLAAFSTLPDAPLHHTFAQAKLAGQAIDQARRYLLLRGGGPIGNLIHDPFKIFGASVACPTPKQDSFCSTTPIFCATAVANTLLCSWRDDLTENLARAGETHTQVRRDGPGQPGFAGHRKADR